MFLDLKNRKMPVDVLRTVHEYLELSDITNLIIATDEDQDIKYLTKVYHTLHPYHPVSVKTGIGQIIEPKIIEEINFSNMLLKLPHRDFSHWLCESYKIVNTNDDILFVEGLRTIQQKLDEYENSTAVDIKIPIIPNLPYHRLDKLLSVHPTVVSNFIAMLSINDTNRTNLGRKGFTKKIYKILLSSITEDDTIKINNLFYALIILCRPITGGYGYMLNDIEGKINNIETLDSDELEDMLLTCLSRHREVPFIMEKVLWFCINFSITERGRNNIIDGPLLMQIRHYRNEHNSNRDINKDNNKDAVSRMFIYILSNCSTSKKITKQRLLDELLECILINKKSQNLVFHSLNCLSYLIETVVEFGNNDELEYYSNYLNNERMNQLLEYRNNDLYALPLFNIERLRLRIT